MVICNESDVEHDATERADAPRDDKPKKKARKPDAEGASPAPRKKRAAAAAEPAAQEEAPAGDAAPPRRKKKKVAPAGDEAAAAPLARPDADGDGDDDGGEDEASSADALADDGGAPRKKRRRKKRRGDGPKVEGVADDAPRAEAVRPERNTTPPERTKAEPAEEAPRGAHLTERRFSDFPLSPEILHGIDELGYRFATPVQAAAIEPALAGKGLLVRAKTGTGKTAAFCIPMVERISAGDRVTRAIVLTPTRELALQVAQECAKIAHYKDLRVTAIYGGVGFGPQEKALQEGTEVVVGTPGRILDHIRRGNLDLSQATFACLDEADEMLSMGFLEDVSKILEKTPKSRQLLLFSATIEEKIKGLVSGFMNDPEEILLSTDTDKVEGIAHVLYETTPDFHKVRALLALLDQEQPSSAIIFCNTREDTATVATFLARQGLDAELLSGELSQSKREQVMARVKRGETQFLVATDVAARGIDISDLSHVVNYSLPEDPAVYMHRTGRTGRAGKKGIAISLAGGADMGTRKVLEDKHAIEFTIKPLPTPEEASKARVERQVAAIKRAMGTMAFEGFVGTVRALKERPDADLLFAATLRAFFLWDRMRKAADEEGAGSVEALHEAREERRQQDRRDDRRDDRREGGGGRDGGGRDGGGRDGGGKKRRRRRRGKGPRD